MDLTYFIYLCKIKWSKLVKDIKDKSRNRTEERLDIYNIKWLPGTNYYLSEFHLFNIYLMPKYKTVLNSENKCEMSHIYKYYYYFHLRKELRLTLRKGGSVS